ncbi:MAG TPA: hypothetical protein VE956_07300 [Nodularia sp. (in: cyanobacteria)]|nr:hypothetical protein [Nodularia sp. (in: cyanobacteria)]
MTIIKKFTAGLMLAGGFLCLLARACFQTGCILRKRRSQEAGLCPSHSSDDE